MKNYNTVLTEKQQKYQHYCQVKLTNMNEYLTGKEILPSDQSRIIEQKQSLHLLLSVKHLKNKLKQLKNKENNKLKL